MVIPRWNRSDPPLWGWQTSLESLAAFVWNQWQACRGMGGNFAMESVADFVWNTHLVSNLLKRLICFLPESQTLLPIYLTTFAAQSGYMARSKSS